MIQRITCTLLALAFVASGAFAQDAAEDLKKIENYQQDIIKVVEKVRPAFVFVGGGSAACISPDGWIITNHHVAGETGKQWAVNFAGGEMYEAEVIGHDPRGDLSLLKVSNPPEAGLPYVKMADSDTVYVGQRVIAVGNPFLLGNEEYEPTITYGIVSAVHRFQEGYSDAIQVDAQINPGNSGGPTFNLNGELLGVNGRIALKWGNRVNAGIGYAIPANQVKNFLPYFKKGGLVRHAYADGITISETTPIGGGVVVASVTNGSPGAKAGLKPGDIIVEAGGHEIKILNRFHGVVGTYPAGAIVPIKYRRGEEVKSAAYTMGRKELFAASSDFEAAGAPVFGVRLAKPVSGSRDTGLEVEEVIVGGPADQAGIRPGDYITSINGEKIGQDYDKFEELVLQHKPEDTIKVGVDRTGEENEVELKLGKREAPAEEGEE